MKVDQRLAKPSLPADPSRRRTIQAGLVAAAAITSSQTPTPAQAKDLPRPMHLTPFKDALPIPPQKEPVQALSPEPAQIPVAGEARAVNHDLWVAPRKLYELNVGTHMHRLHAEMAEQLMWGYDRMFPGPTFIERYNVSALVRINNKLGSNASGPGLPQISTHLHNLHCESISDGFPGDYYPSKNEDLHPKYQGQYFRDHYWANRYSGDDDREALGTLWYHDHALYATAPNVYRGLAGFYLLFDPLDSGDENDPNGLGLPSGYGRYDIPLMITDPRIDASGHLLWDQSENDGHLGNVFAVNGKIAPYLKVERRKYRFRILDASVARLYEFYLTNEAGANQAFDYIANDGNLLPAPLRGERKVALAPAERGEIVVDFAAWPAGTKLYLVNRLAQTDGRGPPIGLGNPRGADGLLTAAGTRIMRFDIDSDPPVADASRVPEKLRDLPKMIATTRTRSMEFDRENDVWTVNGKIFDEENPSFKIKRGSAEIWRLRGKGSWHHPVHIHLEEGRILTRNGRPPPPHERGRKDVFVLSPGEEVRIYMHFRDHTGKYVLHCHNTTHEDHDMMVHFEIEP